ncbi:MAG TPA: glycosyltransferase family 2 protein [Acidimicrobiales bacterium]|nr:glycosyltransferase family 2 protein [Acidimicrobiales bacterium]
MTVDLTTVIVNWRTPRLAIEAARSALAATPQGIRHEVVVIDNASGDGSAEELAASGLEIHLVRNRANVGFAAANNQGIEMASSPLVFLLNSDARLEPGALEVMLARMAATPRAAVVGSRLVYESGRFQRWTAGRDPSLGSAAVYLLGLDRLAPFARAGLYLGRDLSEACGVEWVSAASMLCRTAAVRAVGGMDERYFYMEDVDLCRRLRQLGHEVWYEPAATAVHLMGRSVERSGDPGARAVESLNAYFAASHPGAPYTCMRLLEVAAFAARAGAHGALALAGVDRERHRAEAARHLRRSAHGGPMRCPRGAGPARPPGPGAPTVQAATAAAEAEIGQELVHG